MLCSISKIAWCKCFLEAEFISSVIVAYSANGMKNSGAQPVQLEKITFEGHWKYFLSKDVTVRIQLNALN